MLKCEKEACDKSIYLKGFCRKHYKEFNKCQFNKCEEQSDCKGLCSFHYRVGHFLRNPWSLIHKRLKSKLKSSDYHVENNTQNHLNKGDIQSLWSIYKASKMQNPTLKRINIEEPFSKENCIFFDNISRSYSREFVSSSILKKNKIKT